MTHVKTRWGVLDTLTSWHHLAVFLNSTMNKRVTFHISQSFHFQAVKVCSPACWWNARALAVCRLYSSRQLRPDASVPIDLEAMHEAMQIVTTHVARHVQNTQCIGLAPPMKRVDFSPVLTIFDTSHYFCTYRDLDWQSILCTRRFKLVAASNVGS